MAACHHPLHVTAEEVKAATRSDASPLTAGDLMPETHNFDDRGDGESAAAS
jgi:hypothetical protein